MDRISALRNVEDALADFESGEADLESTERRVLNVLRTYATDFEDDSLAAYRASGAARADGLVVVAESSAQARERVGTLLDDASDHTDSDPDSNPDSDSDFEVERIGADAGTVGNDRGK